MFGPGEAATHTCAGRANGQNCAANMERLSWKQKIERRRNAGLPRSVVFLLALLTFAPAFAASFTTSLDRDTVILGESITLTFKFEGVQTGGMPQLPNIPGLQPTGGTSSGFNSTLGPDGQMQTVQTFAVPFVANRVGDIAIPGFNLEIGGKKFSSAPLKLKVLREDPNNPPAEFATNQVFLWLALPKRETFVGEILVAELRLYLRSEIGNISELQIPQVTGDGYNAGRLNQAQQFQRRVGNATYNVVPFSFTLTPVKSGNLAIGPLNGTVVVHGGQRDFWGNFRQRAQVPFTSEPQKLLATSVPTEGAPANFTGAVGNYTMNVNIGPTNVAAGDPITVRVQISGRGALDALMLPEQAGWGDFKSYPPTAKVETSDPLGLQGTKTFEQIISPENADIKELPAFAFSFFDPETKTFRTLSHPPTKLTVRPGGVVVAPSVAVSSKANANETPQQLDIVPIKQRLGPVSRSAAPLLAQPVFLAAQSVPVLAFLAAFVWRKRTDALANNPRLRRQRQVEQTIRAGLEKLRTHAAQNQSDEFFAGMMRLLQERLGERLDCPASAITEAVIDDRLRPRGLPDSTLDELHELFQACNQARYAPVRSAQELGAVIPRLETALRKLAEVRV
jgi:hypothetical protein